MGWWIWFAWWIIFYCRHPRLLWIYHQKTRNFSWESSVQIYPNKIKNSIVFKVKTGYKLLPFIWIIIWSRNHETKKRSTKKDVDQDKDGKVVPKLESVEVVFVHCNLVNNNYQQTSKVLFAFVAYKQFGQLINIMPHSSTMLSTTDTEFSSIEVWFTGQKSEPLEIEDNVKMTLIIG